MAIPDFQSLMLPLLQYGSDGGEHSLRETVDILSDEFNLTEDEKSALLPSGAQTYIHNRVGWARTYLVKAGLLKGTRRGYFKITSMGSEVLNKKPDKITVGFLTQFDSFQEFRKRKQTEEEGVIPVRSQTAIFLSKTAHENSRRPHCNRRKSDLSIR